MANTCTELMFLAQIEKLLQLAYGQKEIFEEYLPKHINQNKHLKYILDKCGYKITKQNEPGVVGHRGYIIDPGVREYYGFIK